MDQQNEEYNAKILNQVIFATIAAFVAFLPGTTDAFLGLAQTKLNETDSPIPTPISEEDSDWLSTVYLIGTIFGPLYISFLPDVIGRKGALICICLPNVLASILLYYANTLLQVLIAQFIYGLGVNSAWSISAIYISEISSAKIRGTLAYFVILLYSAGTIVEYGSGAFLTIESIAVVHFVIYTFIILGVAFIIPESAYYHLICNNMTKARASIAKLVKTEKSVEQELHRLNDAVQQQKELKKTAGYFDLFLVKTNRKPLIIVSGTFLFQILTAQPVLMAYSATYLKTADSQIIPFHVGTMLFPVFQFTACLGSGYLVDRLGRKTMMTVSEVIVAISLFLLGAFFWLEPVDELLKLIPTVSVCLFFVGYVLGIGNIPFVYLSELFSVNVKSQANSFATTFVAACGYLAVFFYNMAKKTVPVYVALWVFGVCSLAGAVLSQFYLPETTQRTLENIQEES